MLGNTNIQIRQDKNVEAKKYFFRFVLFVVDIFVCYWLTGVNTLKIDCCGFVELIIYGYIVLICCILMFINLWSN
jgi:hypothetical protein